jgi:hypothetical protein
MLHNIQNNNLHLIRQKRNMSAGEPLSPASVNHDCEACAMLPDTTVRHEDYESFAN